MHVLNKDSKRKKNTEPHACGNQPRMKYILDESILCGSPDFTCPQFQLSDVDQQRVE